MRKPNQTCKILFLAVVLSFSVMSLFSATRYSVATGNWNATSTWSSTSGGASGFSAPVNGDNVFIEGGFTVTVTANAACTNLSIANGSTLLVGGFTFTVSGTTLVNGTISFTNTANTKRFTGLVTINGTWNNSINSAINFRGGITNNGTFTAGTGTYSFTTNAQTLTGSLSIPNVTVTTITLTNNGTLTVGTALSGTGGLTQGATGILNIGGSSGITSLTATAVGNTVDYTGTGQTLKVTSYHNLILSGGAETFGAISTIAGNLTLSGSATATTSANLAVAGNLAIGNGTTFTVAGFTLGVTGTTTIGGGTSGTLAISSATGTKTFTGAVSINSGGALTESAAATLVFGSDVTNGGTLTENGVATVSVAGNLTNNGAYSASTGTHTFSGTTKTIGGTNAITIPTATFSGTYTNIGTLTVGTTLSGTGGLTQGVNAILNIGGTSGITTLTATAADNTVDYTGTGQTLKVTSYHNLILSGGAETFGAITTIAGNLTLSGSATATTGADLTVGGNLDIGNGTTFTSAGFNLGVTGTTTVGGGLSGTLAISSATGTKTFTGAVTINSGGAMTESAAATLVFGSDVTNGGTLTENGAATVSVAGNFTNNGAYTASTGTHTFSGTTKTIGGTNSISIPTATFTGSYTNSGTLTVGTALTVTGVTLTNNGTITASTALSGTGGVAQGATGILNIGGTSGITTLTATTAGNSVNYTGTGQTLKVTSYHNLILSGGAETFGAITTIAGNLTLSGSATATTGADLTVGGNLDIGNGTTFTAAGFNLGVTGTTTVGGGLSGTLEISSATGTKTFTGAVTINSGGAMAESAASTLVFGSDVTNGGTLTENGAAAISVAGNFTNNGAYTASTGTHTFSGTTKTIGGTNSISIPTASFTGSYTNSGTLTFGTALTVTGVTFTNNGTITASTALSGTGGVSQGVNATLNLGGTSGITTLTASNNGNTVSFYGADQSVNGISYYNLTISGGGTKALTGNITVTNILNMTLGNITTGANTLTLANSSSANLIHTAGTIIGKFQRAIGSTGTEYLYPVGTATVYNPLKITFTNLTAGQMAVQFMANDIGVAGLPLNDGGTEIFDRQTTGYWSLTAVAPMASTNYSVNLNYTGFTGVDALARIIKRNNGGNLALDGTHGSVANPEITRTGMSGISTTSTDFALGKPSLRITTQPADFSGCTATFSVTVSGKAPLSYQWQENNGGGYTNISNGGIYSGATSSALLISGATGSMNGYQYRCIVTDGLGYTATSSGATLSFILPVSTFGYNYSMDVTLDPASGTSDLTDFPALISFTSSLLRTTVNGGHTSSSNGYDIIFTDLSGSKLDHQIEFYDETTGNYVAWVRIPLLSQSASTTIRMYYGNPTVSVNPSVKSVWTSSFKGVWHLNGTDYTDGTSYSNNGTDNATTNVTGRIAGGRGFNGTTAYISVPTNGFVPNDNNQTISTWANYAATPGGNRNLISFQAGQSGSAIQLGFRGGNAVAWEWGGTILADGGAAPSINTWHYYVYTYDGTTSRIYIDGALRGSSTVAPQTLVPTEGNIGRYNNGEYINASIDESRFSMSPKSSGWILTEYSNQNDPANFISLGTETIATLLASVGICSTTYTLNQGFPSGGTYSGTGVSGSNFNASVAGAGTHSITYLYTDVNGCSANASKNIVVTPLPSTPAASNKECCYLNVVDLEATGTNLKWYSDAGLTTLVGNGTPFATGRTTAGVYTYYATQTINGCESAATTVSLTIFSGITINTQPQPTSICTTGSGTFSVVATGSNLTYQWQVNSVNIPNGVVYSGVTTATLTITNPGIGLNGRTYRCVVSSSCGPSVNSNGAVLTVTTLPVATFSYTASPYCPNAPNPSPTLGGVAGTFSSTAGLVFVSTATGQVNIAASTPGSYTVTNTIAAAGGCGIVTATSPFAITSTLVWLGGSTNWNTPGNWSCGLVPNINTSVQIPNVPNKPVLSAGAVGTIKDLTIDAGSSLTISGNTIQISGAISNSGTFTASSGTIELNGSAAQSINANTFTGNTVRNLTINNAAGVSLGGTLNVSGILIAQSGIFSAGDFLTLISDGSGTALISGSGTGSVTGNVTMQRYLPSGFGYKYFSSPVQSATVNDFSDDMTLGPYTFYRFDENSTSSGWISYHTPTTNPLGPLQGYAINFGSGSAPNTVDVTGPVNDGPQSVTLYNNNRTFTDGFNLVGNPYPSPIDWNAGSGWTKTNLDNAIYYFKASATDQYGGRYGSYIGVISSDGDSSSNIIPSMQGFFVRVSTGTFPVTGTLGMTNSVRVTDMAHPFLKSAMMFSTPLIRLTAGFSDDNESFDPAVIYFDEKATIGFDSQLDALKLYNTDYGIANLYSLGSDGKKLSINALPLITDTLCSIPLGLNLNRTGTIIIKVKDIDASLSGMRVYLTDIVTGSVQDLSAGNQYQISLAEGEYTSRFFLNLDNLSTHIPTGTPAVELFTVYSSHGILKAQINTKPGEKGTLYIYNLMGQVLYSEKIYEPGYHEFSPGIKDGIYLVTFVSGNKLSSKKIIIQN